MRNIMEITCRVWWQCGV